MKLINNEPGALVRTFEGWIDAARQEGHRRRTLNTVVMKITRGGLIRAFEVL